MTAAFNESFGLACRGTKHHIRLVVTEGSIFRKHLLKICLRMGWVGGVLQACLCQIINRQLRNHA